MNNRVTKKCDIPLEEVTDLANKGDYLLLDVRTPEEHSEGALKNAVHIPIDELEQRIHELEQRIHELEPAKDKTIMCYCKLGGRADKAANLLKDKGFPNVVNIGGYEDFKETFV